MFGCKCYIFKESGNGNFYGKCDEVIFLGYSTRIKACKCLNASTNKVVESANVNFDEHAKVQDNESIKKPHNTNPLYTSTKECLMKKNLPIKLGIDNKF